MPFHPERSSFKETFMKKLRFVANTAMDILRVVLFCYTILFVLGPVVNNWPEPVFYIPVIEMWRAPVMFAFVIIWTGIAFGRKPSAFLSVIGATLYGGSWVWLPTVNASKLEMVLTGSAGFSLWFLASIAAFYLPKATQAEAQSNPAS